MVKHGGTVPFINKRAWVCVVSVFVHHAFDTPKAEWQEYFLSPFLFAKASYATLMVKALTASRRRLPGVVWIICSSSSLF